MSELIHDPLFLAWSLIAIWLFGRWRLIEIMIVRGSNSGNKNTREVSSGGKAGIFVFEELEKD